MFWLLSTLSYRISPLPAIIVPYLCSDYHKARETQEYYEATPVRLHFLRTMLNIHFLTPQVLLMIAIVPLLGFLVADDRVGPGDLLILLDGSPIGQVRVIHLTQPQEGGSDFVGSRCRRKFQHLIIID